MRTDGKPNLQVTDFNGIHDEVIRLVCLGHTTQHIAKSLGISISIVNRIRTEEFRNRNRSREEMRQQTEMELNWLMRPLKERYEKATLEDKSREDAMAILKIIECKKKLFALDEAIKLEVRHVDEMSDDELRKELERNGLEFKQLPAASGGDIIDADYTVNRSEQRDDPS